MERFSSFCAHRGSRGLAARISQTAPSLCCSNFLPENQASWTTAQWWTLLQGATGEGEVQLIRPDRKGRHGYVGCLSLAGRKLQSSRIECGNLLSSHPLTHLQAASWLPITGFKNPPSPVFCLIWFPIPGRKGLTLPFEKQKHGCIY
jgi:hypothetical protein